MRICILSIFWIFSTHAQAQEGFSFEIAEPQQEEEKAEVFEEPTLDLKAGGRIAIVLLAGGISAKEKVARQRELITAFQKVFGARVRDASEIMEVRSELELTDYALKNQVGITYLAKHMGADHVVVLETKDRNAKRAFVKIYQDPKNKPAGNYRVSIFNWRKFVSSDADSMVDQVRERAAEKISLERVEAFGLDQEPAGVNLHEDILAEMAREQNMKEDAEERRTRPRRPSFAISVGAEVGTREVGVGGPKASQLTEFQYLPLPAIRTSIYLAPLRFLDRFNEDQFGELYLEASFQRNLSSANFGGDAECPVDDDRFEARLAYRVRVGEDLTYPRIGLGLQAGYDRTEFRCGLPVLSTNYILGGAAITAAQPILPTYLEIDAAFVASQVFGGVGETLPMGPAWQGSIFLQGYYPPFLYGRMGARFSFVELERADALEVSDFRTWWGLEVGAYY